jgi:gas vesicle protein
MSKKTFQDISTLLLKQELEKKMNSYEYEIHYKPYNFDNYINRMKKLKEKLEEFNRKHPEKENRIKMYSFLESFYSHKLKHELEIIKNHITKNREATPEMMKKLEEINDEINAIRKVEGGTRRKRGKRRTRRR